MTSATVRGACLLVAACLWPLRCAGDAPRTPPPATYDVYAAVLRHAVLEDGWAEPVSSYDEQAPIERLVVLGETDPEGERHVSYGVVGGLDGLDSATVADFNSRSERVRFTDSLRGVGEYEYVSFDSVGKVFESGWRAFYRAFPGSPGIVAFSNVGFGADGRRALVSMMHLRGGTSGHTTLYVLEKVGEEWTVVDESRTVQY
jgi:hypothetical protein